MAPRLSRRELLHTFTGVGGVGAMVSSATAGDQTNQQESGGWPMFNHDAANTGFAPRETGPTDNITEQWRFQAGGQLKSSPAVVDGTVYFASADGHVYAVSATDGTEQWRSPSLGRFGENSGLAVVDGTIFTADDVHLYGLDATSGTEQWRAPVDQNSQPTVTNGTIYLGSGRHVVAVSAADGAEQWRFETQRSRVTAPAVNDGTVYAGSGDGNVYALSTADGSEQWRFQTGGPVESPPAVVDGTVYVGSNDTYVYALAASDGTERWKYRPRGEIEPGKVKSSPVVVSETVIVATREHTFALAVRDGTEQWRIGTAVTHMSPAVVSDTVYLGDVVGTVYAIAVDDGSERWRFETRGARGESIVSSPAVVNGTVYIGGGRNDHNLYALQSAESGFPTWLPIAGGLGVAGIGIGLYKYLQTNKNEK